MLIEVLRRWMREHSRESGLLSALTDTRLAKALDVIHGQTGEPWTVESLAQEAGMSRAAFAQTFQKIMGQSPVAYLTQWRMVLANERFGEGHSLLAVALSLGYRSEAAFAKTFKKVMGITPGKARKKHSP